MNRGLWKLIKNSLLYILVICMTVCQLTPVRSTYALEEEINEEAEVVILGEDISLREESSKTFILSDKTMQKVIYSMPVHYEENGQWKEIDNRLIDDGLVYIEEIEEVENEEELNDIQTNINEEVTDLTSEENMEEEIIVENETSSEQINFDENELSEEVQTEVIETNQEEMIGSEIIPEETVETQENEPEETEEVVEVVEETIEATSNDSSQVVGYKNKNGNLDVKFSKKVHQKNMVSIQDGDYKLTWGFKDFEYKSYGVVSSSLESTNLIESAYNHVAQQIVYSDVMFGIDLVYYIDSLGIKENIVIKEKTDRNTFEFEYKTNNLSLYLTENGEIEAINENGKVVFYMPKPYMYDEKGDYCDNVHYEISQKNKKYTIKIVADQEWLNSSERTYPITIDPVTYSKKYGQEISTVFVSSNWSSTNFSTYAELVVGRDTYAYQNCRSLFKFNLPTIDKGNVIVDAKLAVCVKGVSYLSGVSKLQLDAHKMTKSWSESSATWSNMASSVGVNGYYDNTILDYEYVKNTDTNNPYKYFDITSLAKEWYSGEPNNGVLLKSHNENGADSEVGFKVSLWSEDYYGSNNYFPYVLINYRSNKGLESYYDYTSFSATGIGDIYVDNYSGNSVVEHVDASTYGSRAPVSISHVYNGYMAGNNQYKVGKGWKLNIQQTLLPSSQYGLPSESAAVFPYVYMDGDGTSHYFVKKDNQYFDEDGLGLELKVLSSGYSITDKQDTVMTFNSSGNITSIKDINNNEIKYTYEGSNIKRIESGNGQVLTLNYANGYLNEIRNAQEQLVSFEYENQLLKKIYYFDGRVTTYDYDEDSSLVQMTSSDETSIEFSYSSLASGKQVTAVVEKDENGNSGQTILFDRSKYNTTIVTTSGADGNINSIDDVKTELQFDNAGRLITTHSYTNEKDLGASIAEYTASQPNNDKSNLESLNRVTKVGSASKNVTNMMVGHNCESMNSWYKTHEDIIGECISANKMLGDKSIKLHIDSNGAAQYKGIYQILNIDDFSVENDYTVSVYINVEDLNKITGASSYGAALMIEADMQYMQYTMTERFLSDYIVTETNELINNGWRRISLTFNVPYYTTELRICGGLYGATGVVYFDGFQIEQSSALNSYNMLENSSFENGLTSWQVSGTQSEDGITTNIKKDGENSVKLSSSVEKEKIYKQVIPVDGEKEDSYIISSWAYGKGMAPKEEENREFGIGIKVNYSDGSSKVKDTLYFNNSISDWQYSAKIFDLDDEKENNLKPVSIEISLISKGQANTVYFDHLHLTKSKITDAKYDNNGNMISSDGVKYTYDDKNDLKTMVDKNNKTTSYIYNDKHQQTSVTTPNNITTATQYDDYGNVTGTMVSTLNQALQMWTQTEYDDTNSFVSTAKDADGYTTKYEYDTLNGLIEKITDARNYQTNYTYVDQLLTKVTSSGVSVEYGYDEDHRLSEIRTATDDYSFTYDSFGNRSQVKINNQPLANYIYQTNNGFLSKIQYANGYTESFIYDEYGNTILVKENNIPIQEDFYNSEGVLYKSLDYKANFLYVYEYDFEGRLTYISVLDTTLEGYQDRKVMEFGWGYDNQDRIVYESFYHNGKLQEHHYTYNNKDLLSQLQIDANTNLTYEYDPLERLTSKTISTPTPIISEYEYTKSKRGSTYTTSKVEKETIGNTSHIYGYDKVGNITSITTKMGHLEEMSIDYVYDGNSQLIAEFNEMTGQRYQYFYDASGNITSKRAYELLENDVTLVPDYIITYQYDGNQLINYNGNTEFEYDSLGNPTKYLGKTMTWNGRQLSSINNYHYTYDSTGLRKTKTANGTIITYDYSGSQLIHEKRGINDIYYSYDESGNLAKICYNNVNYYVACNVRGDVEAIYNASGQLQARYVYDAWGKVASILDANNNQITDTNHIGHINPIRYRGYYYDTETSFYYLQSRYYDPEVGRFISADGQISDIGGDVLGYNLYTYCMNNPVNMSDESGTWPSLLKVLVGVCAIVIGAVVVAAAAATGGALVAFTSAVGYGLVSASVSGVVSATTSIVATAVSSEISGEDAKTTLSNIVSSSIEGFANGFMWGGIVFGGSRVAGYITNSTRIFDRHFEFGKNNFFYGKKELTIWRHGKDFRIDANTSKGLHYHWRAGKGGITEHRYEGINEIIGILSGIFS